MLCVVMLLGAGGCGTAQIHWSPDGTKAAWCAQERAWVIDETGQVLGELGTTIGGFAWSADSGTLYFTVVEDAPADAATQPTAPAGEGDKVVRLGTWREGKIEKLATIEGCDMVVRVMLSPDGKWLAIIACLNQGKGYGLYTYGLEQKKLEQVSASCGLPACFSGANRLAFVEADRPLEDVSDMAGKLVEVTLNAPGEPLPRSALAEAMPSQTMWMQPLGEDILFTAIPRSFPGKTVAGERDIYKLYHYSRADGAVTAIADDVGPLFAPSPDGRRILFEKLTLASDEGPGKHELAVMNKNGSDTQVLRALPAVDNPPMYANWRGNDQITFNAPFDPAAAVEVDQDGRAYLEVVLYKLEGAKLHPVRTLSEKWDNSMKPYYKPEDPGK